MGRCRRHRRIRSWADTTHRRRLRGHRGAVAGGGSRARRRTTAPSRRHTVRGYASWPWNHPGPAATRTDRAAAVSMAPSGSMSSCSMRPGWRDVRQWGGEASRYVSQEPVLGASRKWLAEPARIGERPDDIVSDARTIDSAHIGGAQSMVPLERLSHLWMLLGQPASRPEDGRGLGGASSMSRWRWPPSEGPMSSRSDRHRRLPEPRRDARLVAPSARARRALAAADGGWRDCCGTWPSSSGRP
jgi:hypothetical protein